MTRYICFATLACLWLLCVVSSQPTWAVTLQEEIDLGRKLDEQILKENPQISDPQALKEINEIGQKLVKHVLRPEIKYHFRILRGNDLNAFTVPGGYIYFFERLWKVLRHDERVGVLAHEIIHCDRRHVIDAILKAQRRQIWIAVLLTALKANETWANIADLAHQLYTLKYSRGDERQADELGMQLCHEAGFNPAGLLLAMRKIRRFANEQGGEPPKIFSSHPPTTEREKYLTELLQKMGVPVPPEEVKEVPRPHKIAEVASVSGQIVTFTTDKPLSRGSVVWLMNKGWDFYYEVMTAVPIARAVVTEAQGGTYKAIIYPVRPIGKSELARGVGVYAPPLPSPERGVGRIVSATFLPADAGKVELSTQLPRFQRLLARQVVWDEEYNNLIYANAGYVVLTGGANKEDTYVGLTRPEYSYAPISQNAVLVKLDDPDQKRWYGPIVSIGRSGQTIELLTPRSKEKLVRDRDSRKVFDVAYPPWDQSQSYDDRVVGKAVLSALDGKIVLQMVSFRPGWSIRSINIGFDIYEAKPEATGNK
ncbi:MAG: M48 family metalloprotease [Armatimonadota bacterium]